MCKMDFSRLIARTLSKNYEFREKVLLILIITFQQIVSTLKTTNSRELSTAKCVFFAHFKASFSDL